MENRLENKISKLVVLFLVVALTASIAQADLVGHWAFDEGTGTTAYDSSPNHYDGTLVGTPTWDSGPEGFGGALLFDAGRSGDGVECGRDINPSVFTLAIWAYCQGTDVYQHFMTKSDGWDAALIMWQWELWSNSGTASEDKFGITSVTSGSIVLSTDVMPENEWVHLAITFDGSVAQLFINGVPDPLGPQAFVVDSGTNAMFYIGVENRYRRSFDGYLDEARVYSHVLSQDDIMMLMATDAAINIFPANGASPVAVDTDLSWGPPPVFTPTKYDLYYKVGDPNFATGTVTEVLDIPRTDPCNVYNPPVDFANDTTIYWRVDSYAPSYPSDPCIGDTWSFTTAPAEPVVTKDPVPLTVAIGGTAVFTVEDVGGETYVWKRQSNNEMVGGNSSTLTLTNVQKDPCENSYYCIVSNASGSVESAAAGLWTKRLIALYEFEDNLDDSEADGWDGAYTDPNTENPTPTPVFASGLEGQALQLTADALHVRITGSEDYFNFYPLGYSANVWIKTEQSGWGALACKQMEADDLGWTVYCGDGAIWNGLRGVGSVTSDAGLNDNQWHMVTATYDAEAGVITTYVDGEPVGSDTSTDVALTNAYPVILGTEHIDGVANSYDGLLDSVGIYSYALSPVEVAVLYTDVAGGNICLEYPEYDFNEDCVIDILDFAMLTGDWMECNIVPTCIP